MKKMWSKKQVADIADEEIAKTPSTSDLYVHTLLFEGNDRITAQFIDNNNSAYTKETIPKNVAFLVKYGAIMVDVNTYYPSSVFIQNNKLYFADGSATRFISDFYLTDSVTKL